MDRNGLLYLADAQTDTVAKVNPSTNAPYVQIGSHGTDPGDFNRVTGVALDDDCNVYVSDKEGGRVQKFSYETGCS